MRATVFEDSGWKGVICQFLFDTSAKLAFAFLPLALVGIISAQVGMRRQRSYWLLGLSHPTGHSRRRCRVRPSFNGSIQLSPHLYLNLLCTWTPGPEPAFGAFFTRVQL